MFVVESWTRGCDGADQFQYVLGSLIFNPKGENLTPVKFDFSTHEYIIIYFITPLYCLDEKVNKTSI